MAFDVYLLPEAQQDYDDIVDWYEKQQIGLGLRFYSEMEYVIQKLRTHPTSYGFYIEHFRDFALPSFPYRIVFTIQENQVQIFAVFHTGRNDIDLRKRLQ